MRGQGRILAPDLIGMGASGKPAIGYRFSDHARYLGAWLDKLALDRIVFVTHDWGAALALDWWAHRADRVHGLVFSEPVFVPVRSWEDFPPAGRATFQAFREGEAWLPVLHTQRGDWHFTALFSNTARAHELGRVRDWVVIYGEDKEHGERHYTVVSAAHGPLAGRRVVRGREADCWDWYARA